MSTLTARQGSAEPVLAVDGHCPICERDTTFVSYSDWLRDGLTCTTCPGGSIPRERALALVLSRTVPDWRDRRILESSPAERGISLKLREACRNYLPTQFYPDAQPGAVVNGFRNENLEALTFADAAFDVVVTLDVLEHVYRPNLVLSEIYRVLASPGVFVATFPIMPGQKAAFDLRIAFDENGTMRHLKPPEYHGNPVDASGALVTYDYGYDIHTEIARWAPFEVEIVRFSNRRAGILGDLTDVLVAVKR